MNTILIADREQTARLQIREQVVMHPGLRVVGESENCYETLRLINSLEPDVLFLDVQLGGDKTFDLVRQAVHLPKIIYMSSSDLYVREAFDHQALDYLLKPCVPARLETALQKIVCPESGSVLKDTFQMSGYPGSLFLEHGRRLKRVSVRDIHYCRASGDYTKIFTAGGEFLSSSGIGSVERRLDPACFVRVHRSFIINTDHVDSCYRDLGRFYLVMGNGQEIAVGKNYLGNIKALIL